MTATAAAPPSPEARVRLRDRWARLGRVERVLASLVAAVVVLRVLVYLGVAGGGSATVPGGGVGGLVGDESYYLDAGRALSNAVRDLVWLRGPDTAELDRIAVGSAWFMPGMSVVVTPLYLLVPDAPVALVRGYLVVLSTALLLLTARRVRRTFGDVAAGALLVFPGLVPMYAAFGAAAWGDSAAGLVLALMLCQAVDMVREVREHGATSRRSGVVLGLLAIAAVYCRSSVVLVVIGVLGVTFVTSLALAGRSGRGRVVLSYVVAGVAFVAVLAPWSLGASAALDARVVTTVSVPTVRANTFGDRDVLCFGECDPGSSIWFAPLRYSREQGRATGVSETVIAAEMSARARRDVTATSYARDVGINTGRYFADPGRFAALLAWKGSPYDVVPFVQFATAGLFYPAVLVLVVVLGAVARRSWDHLLELVLVKVGVVALLVQPFVHISGPRYWTTMAPLIALGAALLWQDRRLRRGGAPPVTGRVARALHLAQVGLGLLVLAVVATVGLVAL